MSHKKVRQHYVPKAYLRNFSSAKEKIFVFDKNCQKAFPSNITDICAEKFFYDVPPEFRGKNTKPQLVEVLFSDFIEPFYSQLNLSVIENIENHGCITAEQKEALAYCITMQILRTRKFRDEYIQNAQGLMKSLTDILIKAEGKDIPLNSYNITLNEGAASVQLAEAMFNPENHNFLINALNSHIWIVGKNVTERPFYTSDSPIVLRPNKKHPVHKYSGYSSVGIEIAFPLSSKYIIKMYEKTFFEKYAILDRKIVLFGDEQVWDMNHLQVLQCHKRVFSISDQFEDAKAICERHNKQQSS